MRNAEIRQLEFVEVDMTYYDAGDEPARVRIFPPSSGRKLESPPQRRVKVNVYDCRPMAQELTLDVAGFELLNAPTQFDDYYDAAAVKDQYYGETAELLKQSLGAEAVFVFDHNVRNKPRAKLHQAGVSLPTDGAHNDYTLDSGPRRIREVLEAQNADDLIEKRAAIVNVWRPIRGPVQDHPLAICDARTTGIEDFIDTQIEHYSDSNFEQPNLAGQIYSFQHNARHRWFYASDMQDDEVLFLKCFDTATDGRACFTGHTGFINPTCPEEFIPRESIEARTVVVFPEAR
ncbi:MAG: CmcJ/NvfI family oxidoreductase [Pseudomonadota bacterium]